jgi:hypothetical protein
MTDKTAEFQQVDLNDLSYFWLPNGAPCFLANRKDICDQVEGIGFQIYYLIGTEEVKLKNATNKNKVDSNITNVPVSYVSYQQIEHKGSFIKVVKNIVGRAISFVDEDFGNDLISFKEEAMYNLPPIPLGMVKKLDEFFRLVYAQHGTESIVILTFDPTKTGSDGWGILVPDQTNTASHCKYDPDSIAALKEDHVIIVGSVHSHPEMAAYASGTDHEDQADFDGLHITYGWQKSVGSGMTQYHAELQMGGSNYVVSIDDVFESFNLEKDPDPEVVEWTSKVKKTQAPALGAYNSAPYGTTSYYSSSGTVIMGHGTTSHYGYSDSSRFVQKRSQTIPPQVIDAIPYNAVLVAEIDTSETGRMVCPSCDSSLFRNEIYTGSSCLSCDIPIVAANSHIEHVVRSVNGYQNKRNRSCEVPYYLWIRGYNKGHSVLLIKEGSGSSLTVKNSDDSKLAVSSGDNNDSAVQHEFRKESENVTDFSDLAFELEYWATRTWCCHKDVMNGHLVSCGCTTMVTEEHAIEFDEFCFKNDLSVYKTDSDCESCVFYYSGGCNSYRQLVVDFKNSSHKPNDVIVSQLERDLEIEWCEKWQSYMTSKSHIEAEKEAEAEEGAIPYDSTY